MPVLIIDGIIATGKTTLIAELQRESHWIGHPTKMVISEHITERVLEGKRPTTGDRLTVLGAALSSVESLYQILQTSKFAGLAQYAPWVIMERFHLTHAANDSDMAPYLELEARLGGVDTRMVFLYHPPDLLEARIEETRSQRGTHWCSYLDSFGGRQGAFDHFWRLQERSWEFFRLSRLPKVALDARNMHLDALNRQVTGFWLGDGCNCHLEEPSCTLPDGVQV